MFREEYKGIENNISFVADMTDLPGTLIPEEIQDDIINAIEGCQNGVISMLSDFPGTVESSSNLAIVKSSNELIEIKILVRSSSESRKASVCSSLESIFALAGAKVEYGGSYGGSYSSSGSNSVELTAVYNFISNGRYRDALNALNGIPNRDARWYYYSAVANAGIGNNLQAMNDANRAASMEPQNPEYRNLVNQLQWRTNRYQGGGMDYGRPQSTCGTGNMCCDLCVADQLCECMGGDLCSCM